MKLLATTFRLILLLGIGMTLNHNAFSQSAFWEATTGSSGEQISITTADDGRIYAAGVGGVYRSSDNGASWTSFAPPGAVGSSVAVNPRTGAIFIAGGERLYRSTNDGSDWSVVRNGNGLVSVLATKEGIVIASSIPDHSPHPQVLRSS